MQLMYFELVAERLCFDELPYYVECLCLCLVKIVVYDNAVELFGKSKFIFCPCYALVDNLWGVGGAGFQPSAQFLNRRRLYEDAESLVAIVPLNVSKYIVFVS